MLQSPSEPESNGEARRLYLREWRDLRLLTMRALASKAGVALETVRALELPQAERQPYTRTVRKLAKALGIKADDLYRMPEEEEA